MYKFTIFFVLISVLSGSKCWVFNNVNYEMLAQKSFDLNLEQELENEIDEEYFPQQRFSLIFPGTKWCGAGNIADGYDDVGPSKEADLCCRDHDNCPEVIPAGETKYNLTNNAFYSRLSCNCDETFRQCLRKAHTKTANTIGKMYFNALGTKCYRDDYPVIGCKRKGGWLNTKCIEHEYNTTESMRYQWFDVPNYYD